ncbi:MAG: hypothetical protein ACRDJE_04365 [Dehalococcoidia bacterium]
MNAQPGSRLKGDVLLIGSMPSEDVEQIFRAAGTILRGHAGCLPDGEVGVRKNWVGMLPVLVFSSHPSLEEVRRPPPGGLEQPEHDENAPPVEEIEGTWTFRVKPGAELRFDDLKYAGFAKQSYEIFRRLRDEGAIEGGARFQLCLPAPNSAINAFFEEPEQWPAVQRAYMDRLRGEIADVLQTIPADDLAVQFDLAWEVVDLAMGERNYFRFWPRSTREEKLERHTSWLEDLSRSVPDEALLGFHWCYGTWGGWPMTAMADLALCVQLSNAAVRRSTRRVDYVHMPVVRDPDEAFFEPLRNLETGDTKVFLGLIHESDIEGFPRRLELARGYLPNFGVAGVCGYGRLDPHELPAVLDAHAAAATALNA